MVLWPVGGVPVVKSDVKTIQIRLAPFGNVGNELLGRDTRFLSGNHDGRAMGVIGADEVDLVALHALKTHPDVGLDVLHDVANVKVTVGIRQGGGDKELARGHRTCWPIRVKKVHQQAAKGHLFGKKEPAQGAGAQRQ